MTSEAAKQVKFGFWIAAGFMVFMIVVSIICILAMRALGSSG